MGDDLSLEALAADDAFVADLARYMEGGLSEKEIRKKYRFSDAVWLAVGEDDRLVEAIEAEKTRRIRSGSLKRERAQQLVVEVPRVLGDIMLDPAAKPETSN